MDTIDNKIDFHINIKSYGKFNNDATQDMSDVFQHALDELNSKGGGVLLVPKGYYRIDKTLIVYPYTTIKGVGYKTNIRTYLNIPIFTTPSDIAKTYQSINIENLTLEQNGDTYTNYHIDFNNTVYCNLNNVTIINTTTKDSDFGGASFTSSDGVKAFMTVINKCWFRNSSIRLYQTDSKIINSYVWAEKRPFSINIGASNCTVINTDVVPSQNNGGIFIYNNKGNPIYGTKIESCFIDGSYNSVNTSMGIVLVNSYGSLINNCYIWNCKKNGIYLEDSSQNQISNCFLFDNNREDNSHSEILINSKINPSNKNFFNNISFRTTKNYINKGYCIEEKNDGQTTSGNFISNCNIEGNFKTPQIKRNSYLTPIENCFGMGFYSVKNGGVVLNQGTEKVTVTHNLPYAPKNEDIEVHPGSSTGLVTCWWINNINATTFDIVVNNPPSGNNIQFYWKCKI